MDEADVDYFIVDKTSFTRVESGWGRLYEPVRTKVAQQFFTPRKAQGFVLAQPPASAVVFTLDEFVVVGREALRTTLATPPR
jgi:hypothetical protein